MPADIWTSINAAYRLHTVRKKEQEELEDHAEWVKAFPLSDLRKRGFISSTRDISRLAEELLKFFAVSSVDAWQELYGSLSVAYRKSKALRHLSHSAAAWLRIAELESSTQETGGYNPGVFQQRLKKYGSLLLKILKYLNLE